MKLTGWSQVKINHITKRVLKDYSPIHCSVKCKSYRCKNITQVQTLNGVLSKSQLHGAPKAAYIAPILLASCSSSDESLKSHHQGSLTHLARDLLSLSLLLDLLLSLINFSPSHPCFLLRSPPSLLPLPPQLVATRLMVCCGLNLCVLID